MPSQPPPRPPQKSDEENIAHFQLLSTLDIHSRPKPFRNPAWKPNQRRNKNLKTILGDANRSRDANTGGGSVNSVIGTNDNSGAATPSGLETPSAAGEVDGYSNNMSGDAQRHGQVNFAEAEKSLSRLVLNKSLTVSGKESTSGNGNGNVSVTYTNIEAAPSLAHSKHYCDITGLPAPYTDPKTRLRYHDKEMFAVIRSLGQGAAEGYLEARGAHVVLK